MASKEQGLQAAEAGAKPKKGKKKLIMIGVVVLVLLGGGGGFFMMSGSAGAAPPPEPGAVVKLDAIHVNLANNHFLKVGLALQGTKKAPKDLDGSKALDIAISLFSGQDMVDLSSSKKREGMKQLLIKRISKAYEDEVMDVYFTEFVMQ